MLPAERILQAEGFDVPSDGLLEIVDGIVFGFAFAIRRDVRQPSAESALFSVG